MEPFRRSGPRWYRPPDSPGQFAPTKELQDSHAQWKASQAEQEQPGLRSQVGKWRIGWPSRDEPVGISYWNAWQPSLVPRCESRADSDVRWFSMSANRASCYQAQFHRLKSRRGPKTAICAVAASMLTAIYHMLKDGTEHRDLGAGHFSRRSTNAQAKRLVNQLTKLGFQVQLEPLTTAA